MKKYFTLCIFFLILGGVLVAQNDTITNTSPERSSALQNQENSKEKQLAQENLRLKAQIELYQKEIQESNIKTNLAILGFILAGLSIVFATYLLIRNVRKNDLIAEKQRVIEEQNNELQVQAEELRQQQEEISAQRDDIAEKNFILIQKSKHINDSIRLGSSIQNTILSQKELLEKKFRNYFLIAKPKDIVGGDFYWVHDISPQKTIICLCDCLGHGIPGGFLTLLVYMLLNEVVLYEKEHEPNRILEKLDQKIKKFLKKENEHNFSLGADAAICRIEQINDDKIKLIYSGAKRPVFFFSYPEKVIEKLKGERKSLGDYKNITFENQEVELTPKSRLYLFSDGFTDQSNEDNKKLGEQNLSAILQESLKMSLKDQGGLIGDLFLKYQGNKEQRDDLLMLGIEL